MPTAPTPMFSAPPAPHPAYAQPTARRQGMAVASMVLGIFGVLIGWIPVVGWFIGFVLALLAIVLGATAIGNANKRPAEFGGKGMAVTGLVLGIVTLAIAVLFWLFVASVIAAFA